MKAWSIRHTIILIFMLLISFVVAARVVHVHIYQADKLRLEGERHYKRNIPMYAYRGSIVDRRGRELAVSAPATSIWADPSDLIKRMPEVESLAKRIGVDFYSLKRKIERSQDKDFLYIKRQISPSLAKDIKETEPGLVEFINERKRVYPDGSIFSHVIGVTDVDGRGVEGVELAFDSHLKGIDGIKSVMRDRLGRSFETFDVPRQKINGNSLALSLDRNIQYITYSELKRAVNYHDAKKGMVVVLDVKRGQVLSMVNFPTYNPNERATIQAAQIRNRAVTDLFEPGSAIKPFIVAAALESGAADSKDVFDVSPGYVTIAGNKIKDSSNYGKLDMAGVLAKSSNVGIIDISNRIDNEYLYGKLQDYGLFSATGAELPGEASSLFKAYSGWSEVYKSYLSFGYGAALNTLQLANAYLVIASNGVRRDLTVLEKGSNQKGLQVMEASVSNQIKSMLKGVVKVGGTGEKAATSIYSVAGKTGTAKKIKDGKYVDDLYTAVFSGMAPADNPRIVVAVMIDEPSKHGFYGGQVAAPVFSRIASRVLRYMDVAPDKQPPDLLAMEG